MCFENGLPRQSADWLAMTGFFDRLKLRKAATGRLFSLSKNLVENEIYAAGRRGRRTVNVLPFPRALSTLTVPPWRRAICCTM